MISEYLSYNPDTGLIKWIKNRGNTRSGTEAGCNHQGYRRIKFNGKSYLSHQVAWYLTHGVWPVQLDHINRDRQDNRLVNLRLATTRENSCNKADNTDFPGVSWRKRNNCWIVKARECGIQRHLGYFKTHLAACYARHQFNLSL